LALAAGPIGGCSPSCWPSSPAPRSRPGRWPGGGCGWGAGAVRAAGRGVSAGRGRLQFTAAGDRSMPGRLASDPLGRSPARRRSH